ncbi:MAG TPA: mycofactocin biosynthesis glycosyltransferase MftF [Acidimicrobiales bacterium]|nr:mycofactocin biosynthesis glycosyltransferase MftF [Acidimicrobiales bacterium]
MADAFPLTVRLDADAQRLAGGRALIGGSPARLFRLGPRGAQVVEAIERGESLDPDARPLVERLLDAGAVHPDASTGPPGSLARLTVVVPAYGPLVNDAVAAFAGTAATIVVDDASPVPLAVADATVIRHQHNRGPAAARNTALAHVATELVAYIDTDCLPAVAWIRQLLPHFADPRVALVAPRIVSPAAPGAGALARYEAARSPLDLGNRPARVAPASRVAYVPGAAFVARTCVLRDVGGFTEALRVGEDVDLVWRLHAAGWRVRYDPSASVIHTPRAELGAFLRQRFAYGTSAGPLAVRHGDAVTPLRAAPLSIGGWLLAAAGHPLLGTALPLAAAVPLTPRIGRSVEGAAAALRLTSRGHFATGYQLARSITRPWWPIAAVASLVSRRARCAVGIAAAVPALLELARERPELDPLRYTALRLLDDAAYGAGVWRGARAARQWAPLLPAVTGWPTLGSWATGGSSRSPSRSGRPSGGSRSPSTAR